MLPSGVPPGPATSPAACGGGALTAGARSAGIMSAAVSGNLAALPIGIAGVVEGGSMVLEAYP